MGGSMNEWSVKMDENSEFKIVKKRTGKKGKHSKTPQKQNSSRVSSQEESIDKEYISKRIAQCRWCPFKIFHVGDNLGYYCCSLR